MADQLKFVSKTDLDAAKEARAEEWRKAYEKLGQEAPPLPEQEEYDPRTLYERLKERKDKEQADFEEKIKFKNQWRGIDDEETAFLEQAEKERIQEQADRKAEIEQELSEYRKAMDAAKRPSTSTANSTSLPKVQNKTSTKSKPKKSSQKSLLAGVIKKKPVTQPESNTNTANAKKPSTDTETENKEGSSSKRSQSVDSEEIDRPQKRPKEEKKEEK